MDDKPVIPYSDQSMKWLHNTAIFLSPFILVAIGSLFTWMQKIDDRQYSMKDYYLSKGDFHISVARLETSLDVRLATLEKSLEQRQKESTQHFDKVITQLTQTNEKLNQLAIELEKSKK